MKTPSRVLLTCLGFLAVSALAVLNAQAVTLTPVADAYVQESAATTNFGSVTSLVCLNTGASTGHRDAYLKFDISSLGTIASARLRLSATLGGLANSTDTYTTPLSVCAVADISWGELTMNWNNRPALGAVVNYEDASGTMPTPSARWVEVDITSYVQSAKAAGQTLLSLAVHNADAFLIQTLIGSRESANPPQLVVATTLPAESDSTYYVATTGSDSNPGTLAQPFRTIQHAAALMIAGDTCYIRAGTYRETVTPANSGTAAAPIVFYPYGSEAVTISGAELVSGWTLHSGSIYKTTLPATLGQKDQVILDGQMMTLARWPNTTLDVSRPNNALSTGGTFNSTPNGDGTNTGTYTDPALTQASGFFNGAKIHFVPGAVWNAQTGVVTSSSPGSVQFNWIYAGNTSYAPQAANPYYLYGLLSLLDAPGEWFIDSATSTLYFWPPQNDSPARHIVETKRRDLGFDLSGRSYITLQNLGFFACKIQSSSGSKYLTLDGLACRYVSHFTKIDHGNDPQEDTGITLRGSHHTLRNSEIAFSAGDGVTLWGDHHLIENCAIHDVDYMDGEKAAINTTRRFYSGSDLVSTSTDHEIHYNTFYNSRRSLMTIGAFRRVSVNHNRFFRSMLGTQDSGAIYTFGHEGEGTELAYNLIHDNVAVFGASGIYLDEGSSGFHVHHNLVYNSYLALQSNLPSLNILSYNNTALGYTYSFRTGVSGSQAGTEVRNSIFTAAYNVAADAVASNNIYSGQDPLFVSPATLDFRIQSGSPARDAGTLLAPYTDGYEGAAPDIGAIEFGQTFSPGAMLATGIPAGPTNLTATVSGNQVQLVWVDNAGGSAGFVVERSQDYHKFTELAHLPATAGVYTDMTPVAGLYFYRVRAGESPYSNYASVTVAGRDAFATIQAEGLDASTGITVNSNTINSNNGTTNWAKYGGVNFGDGANQVTLQFTTFSSLTTNYLELHLGSASGPLIGNVNILGTNGVPTGVTSAITSTAGTQDLYLVFKGSLSWFLDYFYFTPTASVLPSPPTALAVTTVSFSQLQLSWSAPAGAVDNIKVERSMDNQVFTEIGTVPDATTSFLDSGVAAGTIVYYRLRSVNLRGFSDYTNSSSATTTFVNFASWRTAIFNSVELANPSISGPAGDGNGNGVANLLEYALGGDPVGGTTGLGILPQMRQGMGNALQLIFNRFLDRTDLTLTVQAADSLNGTWTDLARSTGGSAFVILAPGAAVSETGSGNSRGVTVSDLYQFSDPLHPRRFLKLEVTQ